MKEYIKLKDFLADISKHLPGFAEAIKPQINKFMACTECGSSGTAMDKYCSYDGKPMEEKTEEFLSDESNSEISRLFGDFEGNLKLDETFPYKFVESYEEYDDDHGGEKYFICYVFKRKSDSKHFEIALESWDNNFDLEKDELREVKKKIKKTTSWE